MSVLRLAEIMFFIRGKIPFEKCNGKIGKNPVAIMKSGEGV
jgi:hypothetical protein